MFNQQNQLLRSYGTYLPLFEHASSLREEEGSEPKKRRLLETTRVLKCCYCNKVFTTLQAFGGHHNKHRREREMLMKEHDEYLTRSRDETQLTLSTAPLTAINNNSSSTLQGPESSKRRYGEPYNEDFTKAYLEQLERRIRHNSDFEDKPSAIMNSSYSYDVDVTLKL